MINPVVEELAELTSTARACALLGRSRAGHYRAQDRAQNPPVPAQRASRPAPRNALSDAERAYLLGVLNSPRFCDKSVNQTWATLLDEGVYLASRSTMHRLLRERGLSRERRAQAAHPPRARPELHANGPNQVWTWDITKLRSHAGAQRGVYYDLYVILDIYSRYVVGWTVAAREDSQLAADLIAASVAEHGAPRSVHADRGTSMTSKPVSQLLVALAVARSHSRPHVSNDCEAQFKTLKYAPVFPGSFGSLADARAFCDRFFAYYNGEHRHSGIGLHTPASVHHGTARQIRAQRGVTLTAAYQANPTRFRHRHPQPPRLPTAAWINQPSREALIQNN